MKMIKNTLVFLCSIAGVAVALAGEATIAESLTVTQDAELHVAPEAASGGDGSLERPYNLVWPALLKARELHAVDPTRMVTILLHAGMYRPSETIVFTEWDSHVTMKAYTDDRVVFSGGRRITGFKPVADRPGVFVADVAACGYQGFERPLPSGSLESHVRSKDLRRENGLFVNGRRLTLARWPNETDAKIESVAPGSGHAFSTALPEGLVLTRENSPDLMASGFFVHLWDREIVPAQVRADGSIVLDCVRPEPPVAGYPFRLLNSLELLDAPGEWYLDRARALLYVMPPEGTDMATAEWIMPDASYPLVALMYAQGVRLENLVFEYVRGDAVAMRSVRDCALVGSVVRHGGGRGLLIAGESNRVEGCVFHDFGFDAVNIKGGDRVRLVKSGNVFSDNEVYETGRIQSCYTPGLKVEGCGIEILNSYFHDIPSSAIRLEGNDHLVESNLLVRVVTESDDQGATDVYANPTYGGIVFRHNVFCDIGSPLAGQHCGSAGIRFDDAVSNMHVEGNRFENSSRGSFGAVQIHAGRYNVVTNNLMIGGSAGVSIADWDQYKPGRWRYYVTGLYDGPDAQMKRRSNCEVKGYFREIDLHSEVWRTRYPWLQHPEDTVCTNTIACNVIVGTKDSVTILNATTNTADIGNATFVTLPTDEELRRIPGFSLPPRADEVGPRSAAYLRAQAR